MACCMVCGRYSGGLGSYLTMCLVQSHLQMLPIERRKSARRMRSAADTATLGVLLLSMLQL